MSSTSASPAVADARPVLYSFRRCPYAIRARLALRAAGLQPGLDLELREVSLRAKPPELLAASARAGGPARGDGPVTVPLLLADGASDGREGAVLAESLAIMRWALARRDPDGWLAGWSAADAAVIDGLIAENDAPFKHHLDRYRYPDRYPGETSFDHRLACLAILRSWNNRLAAGGWLMGDRPSLADWALLPCVRQFRLSDPHAFDAEPQLAPLQAWLTRFLESPELAAVMAPPWAARQPWRSPGWLYHLALRREWQAARLAGAGLYRRSTRGQSLEEVGFVHLSEAHQVPATAGRFYANLPAGEVLLLTIDRQRLLAAGLEVRWEAAALQAGVSAGVVSGGDLSAGDLSAPELFPHLYGALPVEAVLLAEPWQP
ncbi:MAG: DUF952 domain-containing protein [Synechococcaceae cyanobacterium]|nr:DUF952 domain-containing protein [Synechococcaceae cyanobacterium]